MKKVYSVSKLGEGKKVVLKGDSIVLNSDTTQAKLKKVFKQQGRIRLVIESDAKESEND